MLTLRRLVFCLDVSVELKCPNFESVALNLVEIFRVPREVFADEFNRIFAASGHQKIPSELIPLIDFVGNENHSRSRGTITFDNFVTGVYHIGGLTVFNSDGMGLLGSSYVTGVHEAVPVTVARQSPKRSASRSPPFLGRNQLTQLEAISLNDRQRGGALLAIHALGVDLGNKYFLYDTNGRISYISNVVLQAGDKLFLCCRRNPFIDKVELAQNQNIFVFVPGDWKTKSDEFRYVFEFSSPIPADEYGTLELFGQSFASNPRSAIGKLFSVIRRQGLEPRCSDICEQNIGTYVGPDGGHPAYQISNIKTGSPIRAAGIVIT